VIFHSHSYLEQGYASALAVALRRCDATLIASCQLAASALPNSRRHFVYNGVADVGFRSRCGAYCAGRRDRTRFAEKGSMFLSRRRAGIRSAALR
jgi:hypothetical protein